MGLEHPFVDRIRAERAIITAANRCGGVVGAELAGTSKKAIVDWFERIPSGVRRREEIGVLRVRLAEAGRVTRLASSGSHRGAMIAQRVRREVLVEALESVEQAVRDVLRLAHGAPLENDELCIET